MTPKYDEELAAVLALIRELYPDAQDYDVNNELVNVLDGHENIIGTLTLDELTGLWNNQSLKRRAIP
jgi:hypothetical protein